MESGRLLLIRKLANNWFLLYKAAILSWFCCIYLPLGCDVEDKERGELSLGDLIWIKSIWLLELQGKFRVEDLASKYKPYFCTLPLFNLAFLRVGKRKQSIFLWLSSTFLGTVDLQMRIFCFKIYFMLALSTFGWSVQFGAVRNVVLNSDVVFQLEGENPVFGERRRRGLN